MGVRSHDPGWELTASGERIDWHALKDRVDLARVATALLGPAAKRRGRRLLWCCPLHRDRHPSFEVDTRRQTWKCWPCNEGGDAPALVMKLRGVAFPEAVRVVAELSGVVVPSGRSAGPPPRAPAAVPSKAPDPPPQRSSGLPPADALALVDEAARRLYSPEGTEALAYLQGRGLTDETIRTARLGVVASVSIPTRDGDRDFLARGVTIPWFDGDRLALVKVRQPEGREPKYAEAFRDRPGVYPGIEAIEPGRPLLVAEGEFDALLLGQELHDLAAVVTLGSASSRPEGGILVDLMAAAPWYLALDRDEAGDKAAAGWLARAIRVRPPGAYKDWTEAAQAGVNLRRWWLDRLEGTEAPVLFTWDELAALRWGPALHEPEPAVDGSDPYAKDERRAIQTETLIDVTEI
jgi:DNA primase